ncbi:hypothetical protein [Citreimonas salinaria]|uniref:Right handed beta helix region n=1 Tax=Citreimonas salinaria TaxID=321339 RepID=A0A1H3N4B4_9RHOB|nr:hypothetical protein [Citreimonas salinaria]SDY83801.1 hypothetical protein SAMN05444340_12028 [Citreimonas salinaria]
MLSLDAHRIEGQSDAGLINHWIARLAEAGGGDIALAPRRHVIDETVVLRSGVRLVGQGTATVLAAAPGLAGPVVASADARALEAADAWFHEDGVPVRFALRDLMIDGADGAAEDGWGAGCGLMLYGKGFEIAGVQISHMKAHGIVSTGSAKGGQKTWQDEPEAMFDLRVSRCGGDGFVMRGPHDSIIRQAIIAICKGRGLSVEQNGVYNGACDIEFCHAYATDGIAIDLQAKVKAGFLQGDTGRGAGVRIGGSNKTYVDRIECFKTRGTAEDYALEIAAPFTQVGLARVRADWGAGGVHVRAPGCQIGLLDVEGTRNTGGPLADTPNATTGLYVEGAHTRINAVNVRNFDAGTGIRIAPGRAGIDMAATTARCATHLVARGLNGCDLRVTMQMARGETHDAKPGRQDNFALRVLKAP